MIKEFIKKETVLCVALLLAFISCFINPPSPEYISFIDFRTLGLLLALMAVMKGFQESGVFSYLASSLLTHTKSTRQTCAVLIFLCFFSSMIITNDVALITFVPFAIEVLAKAGRKEQIPLTVVLQTIAANLGSMLTPIGNPQNLYLYSLSGMSLGKMLLLMLPYTAISFILLLICLLLFRADRLSADIASTAPPDKKSLWIYSVLFILCMLTVAQILHYIITLAVVIIAILIYNRSIMKKVDYNLLLTFTGFFIFVGNIGSIDFVNETLQRLINGNEILVSVASSQIISNVPAAILLSGFTDKLDLLIIGTNIGGLGTLIASMASLISYKYVAAYNNSSKGRYFLLFTFFNIIFLAFIIVFHLAI